MHHFARPVATTLSLVLFAACASGPTESPPASPTLNPPVTPTAGTPTPADPPTTPGPTPGPTATPSVTPSTAPVTAPPTTAVEPVLPATPSGYQELDQALAGQFEGAVVAVVAQWSSDDAAQFASSVGAFETATGIDITIESIGSDDPAALLARIESGTRPDMAQLYGPPARIASALSDGALVELSFMDNARFRDDFAPLIDAVSVQGAVSAVPYTVGIKSAVWYPVASFEAAGYLVPETWEQLTATTDQMVADGVSPWCISMAEGAQSGQAGTDWIEDILLRTAAPDVYARWANHEIPFDAPEVQNAFDLAAAIFFAPNYAYGGSEYINAMPVEEAMAPAFEDPAGCYLHKRTLEPGGFVGPEDEPSPRAGADVAAFYLPPIDAQYGRPITGTGDAFVALADRPEIRAVAEFLATPESLAGWIAATGSAAANRNTPAELYAGRYEGTLAARILAEATTFAFDASETMPAAVGRGTFPQALVDWVTAEGTNTAQLLADIETGWPPD